MAQEQDLQSKIRDYLTKRGWDVVKTISLSKSGYEDLFCFYDGGITMFIEVKAVGKKPKPLQGYRLKKHQKMGFKAFYCDTWESFLREYESV